MLATGARMKTALFDCEWDANDDSRLLRGVYEHGLGNWDAVKMDENLQLHNKVCCCCQARIMPVDVCHVLKLFTCFLTVPRVLRWNH